MTLKTIRQLIAEWQEECEGETPEATAEIVAGRLRAALDEIDPEALVQRTYEAMAEADTMNLDQELEDFGVLRNSDDYISTQDVQDSLRKIYSLIAKGQQQEKILTEYQTRLERLAPIISGISEAAKAFMNYRGIPEYMDIRLPVLEVDNITKVVAQTIRSLKETITVTCRRPLNILMKSESSIRLLVKSQELNMGLEHRQTVPPLTSESV